MTYLPTLPKYTERDTDRGYTEVVFDQPLDLNDPLIGYALSEEFGTEEDTLDIRDEHTLWIEQ